MISANSQKNNSFLFYIIPFIKISLLYIVVGLITRIILLTNAQTLVSFSIKEWIQIFGLGIINDACIASIAFVFMWLCLIFISKVKYQTPWGYIIFISLGCLLVYVSFFNTIFDDYGNIVPTLAVSLFLYKFVSFGLRLFIHRIRKPWSKINYYFIFYIYVVIILFTAIGEYLFWDEFGVRYNFIAVDYLVYTNEVIGNIAESYPIVPLLATLFIVSGIITFILNKKTNSLFNIYPSFIDKIVFSTIYIVVAVASFFLVEYSTRFLNNNNVFANELQANGIHRFCKAFINSELSYKDFYVTIPDQEVSHIINNMYNSIGETNKQTIYESIPEIHKNIVLITVESLSASFLKQYGNTENLTPNLDSLMQQSLVFNNLYATGNRTVRGLEAVTLCIPPSPGESIIKRPNNSDLFSTGNLLKNKGYTVQYLYGGDSYFDNMKTFFSGNGYEIIDKGNFLDNEITFSNIWGVCDEDMYKKAITVFNKDAEMKKPFFGHIMTVSNHRPFSYPEGKIGIPASKKSRNGGVKYTDYAIGKFIEEAKKQSWFNNTIFVIVADHCASSAGKTEIPIDKYHIPAIVYAPGFVRPKQIDTLVSQIDLMPTVFGLLHFSYDSEFYGKDIFSENYKPKAFMATYQNLGYWQDSIFTILSPVRKVEQYAVRKENNYQFELSSTTKTDSLLLKQAIANYQSIDKTK